MESIWMGIAPGRTSTRVVAMDGPSSPILKARLGKHPAHPRALATLLEAMALWQGQPVRAALCVECDAPSFDSTICRDAFTADGGALYNLVWVPAGARRPRKPRLDGMGDFRDLQRLVVEEVAR